MSRYLLDSDVLSALFDQGNLSHAAATTRLSQLSDADAIGISILTLCELEYSQWGFESTNDQTRIQEFIRRCKQEFAVVGIEAQTAQYYGKLKHRFKVANGASTKAMRRHNVDLLLAATAIATDSKVVSGDGIFAELQQLDSTLRFENWLA